MDAATWTTWSKAEYDGEDPSQWVVGHDGKVVRRQNTGVNAATMWNNPGWNYGEWDQSYAQGWPQQGSQAAPQIQPQTGFQVSQFGSVSMAK